MIVNRLPNFSWTQSLPVTFDNPAIVPFGGTETRALVFMDGSLYAGIGDWEDPELENPQTPGAQVLRLDSPTSSWVEDQDFNQPSCPDHPARNTIRRSPLSRRRISITNSGNNPITPVDVLMAGFWNIGYGRTGCMAKKPSLPVLSGETGRGQWSGLNRPPASGNAEVRSFASYTDSVTDEEMAFAGSNPFGIFSGAFNSTSQRHRMGRSRGSGEQQRDDRRSTA